MMWTGFHDAFPPLGKLPCAIANSAKTCRARNDRLLGKINERTIYLWKLYDAIAKEKKASNFYFANLGAESAARSTW